MPKFSLYKRRGSALRSNHTRRMVSSVAGTADTSAADSLVDKRAMITLEPSIGTLIPFLWPTFKWRL
jgi:hypothetical protein